MVALAVLSTINWARVLEVVLGIIGLTLPVWGFALIWYAGEWDMKAHMKKTSPHKVYKVQHPFSN